MPSTEEITPSCSKSIRAGEENHVASSCRRLVGGLLVATLSIVLALLVGVTPAFAEESATDDLSGQSAESVGELSIEIDASYTGMTAGDFDPDDGYDVVVGGAGYETEVNGDTYDVDGNAEGAEYTVAGIAAADSCDTDADGDSDATIGDAAPTTDTYPVRDAADSEGDMIEDGSDELPEDRTYTILLDGGSHVAVGVQSSSTGPKTNVCVVTQDGSDAQHWLVEYDRDKTSEYYGSATITNVASGLLLDVAGGKEQKGTNVWLWTKNGTVAQRWYLDLGGSGGVTLRSALGGNLVLDIAGGKLVAGTNVQIYTANNTPAQLFRLVTPSDEALDTWLPSGVAALAEEHVADLADGTYYISASGAIRQVVDVSGGSKVNGGNVQAYAANGTGAQRWTISTAYVNGVPWRTITNVGSGKVLDVSGAKAANGTNVQQYTPNGTAAQRWAIIANPDGTHTLRSALGHNLVVDLSGGKTANGTNAQVYVSNNTAAQRFRLTACTPDALASEGATVEDGIYVIKASTGKVMDVPGASTATGKQIQTYAANASQAQAFAVTYDSSTGYYHVTNIYSDLALAVPDWDVLPGAQVTQQTYSATGKGQQWIMRSNGDGTTVLVSPYTGSCVVLSAEKLVTALDASAAEGWTLDGYSIPSGMYTLANTGNGKVMDVTGGSWASGKQIQTYSSNSTLAQKWYLRTFSDNDGVTYYTLQSVCSGMYLSASGSATGSTVVQKPFESAGTWRLAFVPGTGFVLSERATGLRVTASPALTVSSSVASNQGWRLANTNVTLTGLYELAPASATGLRLDVAGGKADDKTNIQVYTSNSSLAQSWALCEVGSSSYFNILSRKSGSALDVAGASAASGTNVWQYTANGTTAQEWTLAMGRYGITFASSLGTVLTADATSSGSNASAATDSSTLSQCWLLKSIAAPSSTYLVAIDPGHGGSDSGAVGNGLRESDLTWKISLAMRSSLVSRGINVYLTRSQNENISIRDRVTRAYNQGATVLVSVHVDSSGSSSAHGASALTPNNSSYHRELHTQGRKLGGYILNNIASLGISSRGYLERNYDLAGGATERETYADGSVADYYGIVRYSRQKGMLGIIIEHGFITNASDAAKLSNSSFLTRLGQADAAGVISMYGTGGSGSSTSSSGTTTLGTAIMGTSQTTVAQMVKLFESTGYSYPSSVYSGKGAATITDFCQIVYDEARAEGVRAEVVFAQAMLETGWLQFGGDVKPEQCNFCGLGATGGVTGASFSNVTLGVRAQVQHLKAYASKNSLNQTCVDPRFTYVTRGSATTVEALSGKWATSSTYGDNVVAITRRLLATK